MSRKVPKAGARGRLADLSLLLPGIGLAAAVSGLGLGLAWLLGGPGLLYVLVLGLAAGPLCHAKIGDSRIDPGLNFVGQTVLRAGVMLLGLRIGVGELGSLTPAHIGVTVVGSLSTIAAGVVLARLLGLSTLFGVLTGGATAICGASAAIAIGAVLPPRQGAERETVFTVLGVTTLSTLVMLIYPAIAAALGLSAPAAGLFIGGSIHDVAQVIGAGFVVSDDAGAMATLTKMLRVSLLAPLVVVLGLWVRSAWKTDTGAQRPPLLPWFLAGFILLAAANSLDFVPVPVAATGTELAGLMLVLAVAAIGLKTDFASLRSLGLPAGALMVGQTVWIGALFLAASLIV